MRISSGKVVSGQVIIEGAGRLAGNDSLARRTKLSSSMRQWKPNSWNQSRKLSAENSSRPRKYFVRCAPKADARARTLPLWHRHSCLCRNRQECLCHTARRLPRRRQCDRRRPIKLRVDPLERVDLRQIVEDDVGLIRMVNQIVLVIILGRIERFQRFDPGHDW